MVRVLINVPKQVSADEPFDVKVLISHPMESGQRRDSARPGDSARHHQHFVCTLRWRDGAATPSCFPAIAANPFLSFASWRRKAGR